MSAKSDKPPLFVSRNLSLGIYTRTSWRPRADLYRCAGGLLVKLELAGVSESDLRISLHNDQLVVEGRRRDWCIPDTEEPLSMEIYYERFRRTISLPDVVDPQALECEFRDGMLLIRLQVANG